MLLICLSFLSKFLSSPGSRGLFDDDGPTGILRFLLREDISNEMRIGYTILCDAKKNSNKKKLKIRNAWERIKIKSLIETKKK